VTGHPAVFATFTAPSFGPVHSRPLGPSGEPRRCRPRRDAPVCEHGRRLSCGHVHDEDDPRLGEPICPDCFDYSGAVVWNNLLGELWRYTTIYVPRALARHMEMTQAQLNRLARVRYVKVAEYQRRGLVHLHVLARLDRGMPTYRADEIHLPPPRFTADLLERAIGTAAADVSAPVPDELGGGRVRWGDELDTRQLRTGDERGEIAGYLAKYATKSTEQAGGLLHAIERDQIAAAPVREHVRDYLRAAFRLHDASQTAAEQRTSPAPAGRALVSPPAETWRDGNLLAWRAAQAMSTHERVRLRTHDGADYVGRIVRWSPNQTPAALQLDSGQVVEIADVKVISTAQRAPRDRRDRRLAKCAHAFGYRGHCLTKSRRYSTTFTALRQAREAFVHEQILARSRDRAQRELADAAQTRIATFTYAGQGHITAADELLAASAAARAREQRRAAREARAMEVDAGGRR
jgi:hypothetical protein